MIPTNASPITFYLRDSAAWLDHALRSQKVDDRLLTQALTPNALNIWELLKRRGACFAEDLQRNLGLSATETQHALWELAAAGLAAADGFDQLRAMIDSERRRAANSSYRKPRNAAGRWSLFGAHAVPPEDAIEQARHDDISIESAAHMLLNRYGVVFRDLLALESNIPRWGPLLRMFRRLEDRGLVRGGRFVNGFSGEQFALPEIAESLHSLSNAALGAGLAIAGSDPANLIGVLIPGERVAAVPGRSCMITSTMLQASDTTHVPRVRQPRHRTPNIPKPPRKPEIESLQAKIF